MDLHLYSTLVFRLLKVLSHYMSTFSYSHTHSYPDGSAPTCSSDTNYSYSDTDGCTSNFTFNILPKDFDIQKGGAGNQTVNLSISGRPFLSLAG